MTYRDLMIAVSFVPLFATAAAAQEAVVQSCGHTYTYEVAPQRAVTLNQQATEIMLALGLEDRMVGTAYRDDEILPRWREAYDTVPVLAEKYPAREVVILIEPDFLFAGFRSAFSDDNLGAQAEWNALGVGTYLVDASCELTHPKDVPLTTAPVLTDIRVIGDIFGVEERAAELITQIEESLEVAAANNVGEGRRAFIFDSGDETPYSIGCCGSPALLLKSVGLVNIAADVEGRWVNLSWERIVTDNPEIIVLIDATASTAAEKRAYMEADPVLSQLDAVREGRFVIVPFSQTILGMQFADGVANLAAQLEALK